MTLEQADPEFTTLYQGMTVAFCCDRCLAKFEANPQRYVANLTGAGPQQSHDDAGGDSIPDGATQPSQRAHPPEAQANGAIGQELAQSGDDGQQTPSAHRREDGAEEQAPHEHVDAEPGEPAAAESHAGHTHDEGEDASGLAKLIAWIGRFHPAVVNFPIAMLTGAALAECLLIATGRAYFAGAGRFCLWVGALGAVAGALLGWCFGGFHVVDEQWILTTHRWLGTATAASSVVAVVVGERAARRPDASRKPHRFALFACAAMVAITGFFGGSLVYGLDHYAW